MPNTWVVGNWKAHGRLQENDLLLGGLAPVRSAVNLGVCVPFCYLPQARARLGHTSWRFGVQNLSPFGDGAYTGEVSAGMAADLGASLAICGHSERRRLFAEDDAMVAQKVKEALAHGLAPILCIGETQEERQRGLLEEVLRRQLRFVAKEIEEEGFSKMVLAYEPVWAIGTGVAAQAQDIAQAHALVRRLLSSAGKPDDVPVLYGGSVSEKNAKEIASVPGVNGALVGGASLSKESFLEIVKAFEKK